MFQLAWMLIQEVLCNLDQAHQLNETVIGGISLWCLYTSLYRVHLHKMRTARRTMSDNGMTVEQLLALGKANSDLAQQAPSTAAPTSSPPPAEKLTNFMDVRNLHLYVVCMCG